MALTQLSDGDHSVTWAKDAGTGEVRENAQRAQVERSVADVDDARGLRSGERGVGVEDTRIGQRVAIRRCVGRIEKE